MIVIRDLMFGDRRHFRELPTRSEEGIASNILADRIGAMTPARSKNAAPDTRLCKHRYRWQRWSRLARPIRVLAAPSAKGPRHAFMFS
jgi:hypothetical protein